MDTLFRKARITRAFTTPFYLLLWSGQSLSRIGDFLYEVALAWWVVENTGSAAALASVLVLVNVPIIVFMLVGGVVGDRAPRALIIFLADLLRGGIVAIVTVLAVSGELKIWQVYIASLLFGIALAFFQPAYTALVPDLVPDEDLISANSMDSLSLQFGRIAGPALAAIVISQMGTGVAFGMNAASFFISGIMMLPVLRKTSATGLSATIREEQALAPQTRQYEIAVFWRELSEGLRFVIHTPWLWLSTLLFALTNVTLAGPYSVAMPVLVKDYWGQDVRVLGLIYGIFPIGYAVSSIVFGIREQLLHRAWLIYGGTIVAGLMLAMFGLQVPLMALGIAALINGAANEAGSLAWVNSLQTRVPRDLLGRVASVDELGSYVLMPVGYAFAGWMTDRFGAPIVFLIGGCVTAAIALIIIILYPSIRKWD
jgi:MFS transporter, DHA3 family, tetracycline resistance protein